MTSPRGIRNNNPGNLRHSADKWQGASINQTDREFVRFDEMRYGIRALLRVLVAYQSKYGLRTVRGIISRWAPPSENDTGAYVNAVAAALGVAPDDEIDSGIPTTCLALARAIARHENGADADQIPATDWAAGAALAFNVQPPASVAAPAPAEAPPPFVPQSLKEIVTGKESEPMVAPIVAAVAPSILKAVLPSIVAAIPMLGKLFGSGSEVSERNLKAAEVVGNIVIQATGATNVQHAAELIATDPAARQAATEAVSQRWFELTEAGGGGIDGARQASERAAASGAPLWRNPAFMVTALVLPLIYFATIQTLTDPSTTNDLKAMVVSLVVGGALGSVLGFFLGSSFTTSSTRGINARPPQ